MKEYLKSRYDLNISRSSKLHNIDQINSATQIAALLNNTVELLNVLNNNADKLLDYAKDASQLADKIILGLERKVDNLESMINTHIAAQKYVKDNNGVISIVNLCNGVYSNTNYSATDGGIILG
jgi:uncharacterized membrane protein YvbJ